MPRKYVCDAGEGGTFADRMIKEGDPFVIIVRDDHEIAVGTSKATSTLSLISACDPGTQWRRQRGAAFDIETRSGAGAYVCEEEMPLLESAELIAART